MDQPYPTSLRIINWIKFITQHKIQDTKIDRSLYAQANLLSNNIEYHLLGNHLLENAFSLVFASYYFENAAFYERAKKILMDELLEQILQDGAHFELSPMYHQIILNRVLNCVNLTQNNNLFGEELTDLLVEKAAVMLGWLRQMTFKNGDIPLVNDAANGIAPTTAEVVAYAARLGISEKRLPLKDSGYRKIERNNDEKVHIMDTVKSQKNLKYYAYLHFHPDIAVTVDGNVIFAGSGKILLKNQDSVSVEAYHFAPEFNKRIGSKVLVVTFRYTLEAEIVL